ncbi:Uncharacterised protein [uncultured archaeon]|nr:Uncharacterised protein [uncultured archaeon]
MGENPIKLKLMIDAGPEADQERLEQLTHELRRDLMDLDVDLVEIPKLKGKAPEGTKVVGIAEIGTLLVTLAPSVLSPVISCINTWVSSRKSGEIVIELNGQKLQLKNIPISERQKMFSEFIDTAKQKGCAG